MPREKKKEVSSDSARQRELDRRAEMERDRQEAEQRAEVYRPVVR